MVHDGIRRVAEGIAAAHDAEVTVDLVDGYPVTVNDKNQSDVALGLAGELVGTDKILRLPNPDHGCRGLQLRAAGDPRCDGVPRWNAR